MPKLRVRVAPGVNGHVPASSTDVNRGNRKLAGGGRDRATVQRLKMYARRAYVRNRDGQVLRDRGDYTSNVPQVPDAGRVAPNRRWFGNTRTVDAEALRVFREHMARVSADPFAVVVKRRKLPLGLLKEGMDPEERAHYERCVDGPAASSSSSAAPPDGAARGLLRIEPFAETFSKTRRRKRPRALTSSVADMANRVQGLYEKDGVDAPSPSRPACGQPDRLFGCGGAGVGRARPVGHSFAVHRALPETRPTAQTPGAGAEQERPGAQGGHGALVAAAVPRIPHCGVPGGRPEKAVRARCAHPAAAPVRQDPLHATPIDIVWGGRVPQRGQVVDHQRVAEEEGCDVDAARVPGGLSGGGARGRSATGGRGRSGAARGGAAGAFRAGVSSAMDWRQCRGVPGGAGAVSGQVVERRRAGQQCRGQNGAGGLHSRSPAVIVAPSELPVESVASDTETTDPFAGLEYPDEEELGGVSASDADQDDGSESDALQAPAQRFSNRSGIHKRAPRARTPSQRSQRRERWESTADLQANLRRIERRHSRPNPPAT
eukprot:ctg_1872.g699